MTEITRDHLDWTIVGRMRVMLLNPKDSFEISETYALFTAILCWVMQHTRIKPKYAVRSADKAALALFGKLAKKNVLHEDWRFPAEGVERIVFRSGCRIALPKSVNFENQNVADALIGLRNATAHGDMRNIEPINVGGSLVGFTFSCARFYEEGGKRRKWKGQITLLEDDMQRIGGELARRYCNAIREAHSRDSNFGSAAKSIVEEAA
ncbi:hypothetical protein MACH24_31520 [Erythrobacter sp. Dej080120_24]|uniref:hypothetical protein n=1 Tax=Erythrobacter sp. Dej080120_24 TaxID=3024837 RepID=UPI0029252F86|nr:hypothetical protein MACH24_31520 [Erythrobacter sp. Dej080120_24]